MKSSNEIVAIKSGPEPEKVIDEGDSLGIGADTHSFYWSWELTRPHDYEPVAISGKDTCLTRLHYHGIVIWQKFARRKGKPIVYFARGFHTPTLCTSQKPTWWEPTDIVDRMVLKGYLIPKINKTRSEMHDQYEVTGYSDKFVDEQVSDSSKFTWNGITYYVIVGSAMSVNKLKVARALKKKLMNIIGS